MFRTAWLSLLLLVALPLAGASAGVLLGRGKLDRVNRRLAGYVVDYTANHGADRRLWWPSLGARRDLYVYLPPGFDPNQRYPVMLWMHGFRGDESSFVDDAVGPLDAAMACGRLPPMIIAAPDGSIRQFPQVFNAGSFFLNTRAGNFEDFVMHDVWNFLTANYPVRPEPGAHVLAGVSMGGGAAFNLGIKYRDEFRVVLGVFPPLNLRWVDCHGNYRANFDPGCWGWRTDVSRRREIIARFFGVIKIRSHNLLDPLFGGERGPETLQKLIAENPIEMLDAYGLQEGELEMFVGYGGRDEFNVDAQVESFLYRARERGLTVTVSYDPRGHHNARTARRLLPSVLDWLAPRVAPYAPGCGGR